MGIIKTTEQKKQTECNISECYGLFESDECLIAALVRCKAQNQEAFLAWGRQLRKENPDQFNRIKSIMKGE